MLSQFEVNSEETQPYIYMYPFSPKGEGNGNPLQYSCLENPMDGGAWQAAVHGVAESRTRLHFHFPLLMHWRRKWQPTPVFLPGKSHGWRSLVGCSPWGRTELVTTETTQGQQQQHSLPNSPPMQAGENCVILIIKIAPEGRFLDKEL